MIGEEPRELALTGSALRRVFSPGPLLLDEISSAARLRERLTADPPDLVITAARLQWSGGIPVLRELKQRWPECPVVMAIDSGGQAIAVEALQAGLDDYVTPAPTYFDGLAIRARVAVERVRAGSRSAAPVRRLNDLLNRLDVGVYRSTLGGQLLEANPAYLRLLGLGSLEEALAQPPFAQCIRPQDRQQIQDTFAREGAIRDLRVPLLRKGGPIVWAELNATPAHATTGEPVVDGLIVDVTERKRAKDLLESNKAHLQQSRHLEALGRLASGIAHDFNNLLTAIDLYCDLTAATLGSGNPARENLMAAKRTSERGAALIRQLVAFARRQVLKPQILDLNAILGELEPMLRRLIPENINVVLRLDPELGTVNADPSQIEQVIVNLALNARDFMPSGGEITLETTDVELTKQQARRIGGIDAGRHALLRVSDTGTGMTPEVMARIFEPFFSDRPNGTGSGIGLASVEEIVEQSGGAISVASEPGWGTTIEIHLPHSPGTPTPQRPEPSTAAGPRGGETVLVVEDDSSLRRAAGDALERAGYSVLSASSGEEACALVESDGGPVHLLLGAAEMTGMGFTELVDRIRRLHPEVNVLCTPGFTGDTITRSEMDQREVAFLAKPFDIAELLAAVRAALDTRTRR